MGTTPREIFDLAALLTQEGNIPSHNLNPFLNAFQNLRVQRRTNEPIDARVVLEPGDQRMNVLELSSGSAAIFAM